MNNNDHDNDNKKQNESINDPHDGEFSVAKRDFCRLGLAFFAMQLLSYAAVFLIAFVAGKYFPAFAESEAYFWLCGSGTIYLVGMPAAWLIMTGVKKRSIPTNEKKPRRMSAYEMFLALLICVGLMQVGSIAATIINNLLYMLTVRTSSAGLSDFLYDADPLIMFAVVVVIGPLLEELVCRKLVIDRMSKYGAMTAALCSAGVFACIHGNIEQLFYAFVLGLFFSFIYLRTENIFASVFLHMCVNLLSGFVPVMLSRFLTASGYEELYEKMLDIMENGGTMDAEYLRLFGNILLPFTLSVMWSLSMLAVAVIGIWLLIGALRRGAFSLSSCRPAELAIPQKKRGEVIFLNIGMLAFAAITAFIIAASAVMQ